MWVLHCCHTEASARLLGDTKNVTVASATAGRDFRQNPKSFRISLSPQKPSLLMLPQDAGRVCTLQWEPGTCAALG